MTSLWPSTRWKRSDADGSEEAEVVVDSFWREIEKSEGEEVVAANESSRKKVRRRSCGGGLDSEEGGKGEREVESD